jgi:6-phosphogluconolactonase (cycloisomerase 2 family)
MRLAAARRLPAGVAVLLVLLASEAAAQPPAEFLYVTNEFGGSVSAYQIHDSGALLPVFGSPFSTGGSGPLYAAVDAANRFLFIVNNQGDSISVLEINGATGALTPVVGSPFATASNTDLHSAAVHPSGAFFYTADALGGTLLGYQVDGSGALSPITGSPFPLGAQGGGVSVHPSGRFVYAGGFASFWGVSAYDVTPSTGALTRQMGTPVSAGGAWPRSSAIDRRGRSLYFANAVGDNVSAFALHNTTGAPTLGSAPTVGDFPRQVAVTPSRRFVYVANNGTDNVSAFAVDADTGALTAVPGAPFAAGDGPEGILVDPSERYVYITHVNSNDVWAYSMGADGALTPIFGSPFAAGSRAAGVASTNHDLVFTDGFETGT